MSRVHPVSVPEALGRAAVRRRLLAICRPLILPLVISAVARTVALVCGIALVAVGAAAVGQVIDHPDGVSSGFATVLVVLVVLSVLKGLMRYLEQFAGHYVAFRCLALLRVFFFQRLEPQAPAAVEGRRSGDLLARVTRDVDRVEVFFAHTLVPAATAVVVPAAVLAYLAAGVHPLSAVVAAPALVAIGLLTPAMGRARSDRAAAELRRTRGLVAQHVTDTVQGVREVLTFDRTNRRAAEMARLEEDLGASLRIIGRWNALRRGTNAALMGLTVVVQTAVVLSLHAEGDLSMSAALAAVAITLGVFTPVLAVEDFAADLTQAYASARRIFEITDAEPQISDPADPEPLPADRSIQVRDVGFVYPGARTAGDDAATLHDVSLVLPAGSFTAIVGPSGSGKSTLAKLLVRFWDPDAGSIELGGVDLRRLRVTAVRDAVAYAPQDPHLFNDTIEANLRLARPDASAEELAEVVRLSALDELIDTEPLGMATVVGESGLRLSGGQRQRVALARTLLRNSAVVVVDEATSQLDAATERRVLDGLREYCDRAGRSLVMVAHRLATVRDAECIVVMDAGRVVEVGTHDELVERDGPYARLLARELPDPLNVGA